MKNTAADEVGDLLIDIESKLLWISHHPEKLRNREFMNRFEILVIKYRQIIEDLNEEIKKSRNQEKGDE